MGDKQTAAHDQTLMRLEQAKKDLEKQKKELTQRENALKKATERQSNVFQLNKRNRSKGFNNNGGHDGDCQDGHYNNFNKKGRYHGGGFGRR